MLQVDGVSFCESIPISLYLAKLAGLYPKNPLDQLRIDEIVAIIDELWNKISSTSDKEPATRVDYATKTAPAFLKLLEKKLVSAGGKFFHGDKPGYADLWCKYRINFIYNN